jgi:hypothetical protein
MQLRYRRQAEGVPEKCQERAVGQQRALHTRLQIHIHHCQTHRSESCSTRDGRRILGVALQLTRVGSQVVEPQYAMVELVDRVPQHIVEEERQQGYVERDAQVRTALTSR